MSLISRSDGVPAFALPKAAPNFEPRMHQSPLGLSAPTLCQSSKISSILFDLTDPAASFVHSLNPPRQAMNGDELNRVSEATTSTGLMPPLIERKKSTPNDSRARTSDLRSSL